MGLDADRRAELQRAEAISVDELRRAVARLDDTTRAALARGPAPYRYDCAVCEAFKACDLARGLPDDDPRWVVFNYHEVPKLGMRSANEQWYGPLATEVYGRCHDIYSAAASGRGRRS